MVTPKTKASAQARALSKLGASKGGKARAAAMTPEERSDVARAAAEARWADTGDAGDSKIPYATHVGVLKIGDLELPCAVLNDGRRVLTQEAFGRAIGRQGNLFRRPDQDFDLPPFLTAATLKPFISEDLRSSSRPIAFRPLARTGMGARRALGYAAELLPQVCRVFLDARDAGVLHVAQHHVARTADLLIRGLATVGIVALVDEATGYQRDRDRDALHKLLELFIAKELLPWTRRFPDEFYREMFRLRNWKAFDHNAAQGPRFAGKLTNQLVYERLPPGVLSELQRKNPAVNNRRRHAHHQFLTENIGNPHLERHIASVTTLMRAARTWSEFEEMANRALPPRALSPADSDPQLRTSALDNDEPPQD